MKTIKMTAKERIMKALKSRSKGLTARELADKAAVNYNTCRKLLGALLRTHLYKHLDKKTGLHRYSYVAF